MRLSILSVVLLSCAPAEGPAPVGAPDGEDPVVDTSVGAGVADGDVYMLDDDVGALVQYDPVTGALTSHALGATPGRLARAAGKVWVTLQDARGIAVFEEGADGLVQTATLDTGAEPVGIAVNAEGTRLYVALSTSDQVVELDADGATLRTWTVAGLPSWLALRPGDDALYVGSATGGTLTWIDLGSGESAAVSIPTTYVERSGIAFPLTNRITGDLAVSADGERLAVPMLMTDNRTPLDPPTTRNEDVDNGYATAVPGNVNRFNPTIALLPLGEDGAPDGASAVLALVSSTDERGNLTRSYLTSVAFSPDGELALGTMEAASRLVAVSTGPSRRIIGGFSSAPSVSYTTPAGPRSLAFGDEDTVYIDCFLDRRIASQTLRELRNGLGVDVLFSADRGVELERSPLAPEILAGRRLFHAADDPSMVQAGAGVSCSTCHLDGRNDGLSWNLEDGYRQTPSLAGGIAATAPVTWASNVASVEDEIRITSEGRMGGFGPGGLGVSQIAAYIESIRAPDVAGLGSDDAAVDRGRVLFARSDVGCISCHAGALYTDNRDWPLYGLAAVNTPSLRRVSTTAPYLHDGRAATLRAVLELSRDGSMGDTSMLSDEEMDDLEAFLRSI